MSVNRYDASTGELTNIASGQRTWVGTKAAYNAAKQAGTLPNNALICITDDENDTIADAVTNGDSRAVTSNAVYNYVGCKEYIPYVTKLTINDGIQQGALKITFPKNNNIMYDDKMRKFTLDIFSYQDQSIAQYQISGYNYDDNTWRCTSAYCSGKGPIANLKVRFGDDGNNVCIWVGELNTVWPYSAIILKDAIVTFRGYNAHSVFDGTSLSFANSFGNVYKAIESDPSVTT